MIRSLILNGRKIDLEDLDAFSGQTDFERATINFLKQWNAGLEKFNISTSGSTGKPKRITISRRQMLASAQATNTYFQLKSNDTVHLCLNTRFIAGQMMLLRAHVGDMSVIAEEPSSRPLALEIHAQISFSAMIPLQLENLLNAETLEKMSPTKGIIVGGAPLTRSLINRLNNIEVPVYATFGMTETVSHIALRRLNGPKKTDFYTTLPGISIKTDKNECLMIKGQVTDEHWLLTNDRVKLMNHHRFQWLGRIDNVLNSGGIKIQLEQVEKIIQNVFDTRGLQNRFICAGIADDLLGQKLILIIEGHLPMSEAELIASTKIVLPKYHAPRSIFYLNNFDETSTGKVNRGSTLQKAIS